MERDPLAPLASIATPPPAPSPPSPIDDDDDDWEVNPEALRKLTEQYGHQQHPLFLDELPADLSSDPSLAALHSIMMEDNETTESLTESFKQQGNDCFKEAVELNYKSRYQDAANLYTQGIQLACSDKQLMSVLYSNRANVMIKLALFPQAIDDCREAIRLNPINAKAYYRAARSSLTLGHLKEAVRFSRDGVDALVGAKEREVKRELGEELHELSSMPSEARSSGETPIVESEEGKRVPNSRPLAPIDEGMLSELRRLLGHCERVREKSKRVREVKENERQLRDRDKATKLREVLQQRGISLCGAMYDTPSHMSCDSPQLISVTHSGQTVKARTMSEVEVRWTVLMLIEEMAMSEVIVSASEDDYITDHLKIQFPEYRSAPWDVQGVYRYDSLVVYFEGQTLPNVSLGSGARVRPRSVFVEATHASKGVPIPPHSPRPPSTPNTIGVVLSKLGRTPPTIAAHVLVRGSATHVRFVENNKGCFLSWDS
eukprot:GHVN01062572.1.p1 GENE.GHVN01062572.1~~GHVN01062572.1.p1  ORF type:complete len:488 (+),score=130.21 GHVN01062572.1:73-1536(+)